MTASVWNPSSGTVVLSNLNRISQVFTASAGQTEFVLLITPFTPGAQNLEVFRNGLKILPSALAEVTDGKSFILDVPCANNDKVEAVVFPATSTSFELLAHTAQWAATTALEAAAAAQASAASISQFTGAAVGGNLVFTALGQRIIGDLSNATLANRLMFQSSTANGVSYIEVVPNGTSLQSGWVASNSSTDPANASYTQISCSGTASKIIAGSRGAGSYLPLALSVGGADVATYSEAAATLGNMTASVSRDSMVQYTVANGNAGASARAMYQLQTDSGSVLITKNSSAGGSYATFSNTSGDLVFQSVAGNHLSLFAGGNTLHLNPAGGLGYGAGAGGTVTQTTSKGTGVTLNKPTGQIIMHNASLAAGASVSFALNNSLQISGYDHWTASVPFYYGYRAKLTVNSVGLLTCTLTNETAGALAEAVTINFNLTKGSNS